MSVVGILFSILGLSLLIFIHELGHYFMAKRAGMKIEVFSIGMGKPIVSWKQNGVKWQICYLIFGGYVRIAGMEETKGVDPYKIRGGFYSKKPVPRLLVAAAGPFVNIIFALGVFTIIYFVGGQKKSFSEHSKLVGMVDSSSELHEEGIRAGDRIISLNNKPYQGFKDVIIEGINSSRNHVHASISRGEKKILDKNIKFYSPDNSQFFSSFPSEWRSIGVLAPPSYVISNDFIEGKENFSPLKDSGVKKGDRIVYADGNIIYSHQHLSDVINKDIALITIERDGKKMHLQVPRVLLSDLKLTKEQKDEFVDNRREMNLDSAIASTYYIPYLVSDGLYVKDRLVEIDENDKVLSEDNLLRKGDKIVAVAGKKIHSAEDFYRLISERMCLLMVSSMQINDNLWTDCDHEFSMGLDKNLIDKLENSIGSDSNGEVGPFRFLKPSQPVAFNQYLKKANPKALEKILTGPDHSAYQKILGRMTLLSGLNIQDGKVIYNPGPFSQAKIIVEDILFSLKGLFSGAISPKHMSGPVGMVKIVHDQSKGSIISGLYWLGMISLNLGFMNLLPIPVLDGGHICFTVYEMVTRKRIKAKVMQRMVLPFVVAIISFFIYITFYDILKIFG